jgi:LmbE family N-acetylglucosaminyl deacetylase
MCAIGILQNSILVAAHPDDEILWFSSILGKVDRTIICFLECKSKPDWTSGRAKSLKEYPLKNLSCLSLNESEVFSAVNFIDPIVTSYGLKIADKKISDQKYVENYHKLKKELKPKLIHYENVFTHNPWGEYGNEEHIQIYRVIKNLKDEIGFNLWFPNYSSNKSYKLMLKYISNEKLEYVTFKANKMMADSIKKLYMRNRCWTWFDDWECFNEESFIKDKTADDKEKKYGQIFPINMINVEVTKALKQKTNIYSLFISKILKMLRTVK